MLVQLGVVEYGYISHFEKSILLLMNNLNYYKNFTLFHVMLSDLLNYEIRSHADFCVIQVNTINFVE